MRKKLSDKRDRTGIVIAVRNPLIQSNSKRKHFMAVPVAFLVILHLHVLLTHDNKAGIGTPVHQMMITSGQTDGA